MRQVVAVVKPFGAQNQRLEENLHLPSNLSPSPSRVVSPIPAPSIIYVVSERDGDSDNESISSRSSYSQGMHTSGDDTDNESGPFSMDIDAAPSVEYLPPPSVEEIPQAAPSVEYLPPPSVEEIPQALVQEVDMLQYLPLPI